MHWLLCPHFEKIGVHIFLICTSQSVRCFVTVDQILFNQYLLTPLLESCRTWDKSLPIESKCSGNMVKSHGQTAGLFTIIVNSVSFDPFAWKLPNLAQWFPLESRLFHWFLGHMVKRTRFWTCLFNFWSPYCLIPGSFYQ